MSDALCGRVRVVPMQETILVQGYALDGSDLELSL